MQPHPLGPEPGEQLLRVAELRVAVMAAEPLQHLRDSPHPRCQVAATWARSQTTLFFDRNAVLGRMCCS